MAKKNGTNVGDSCLRPVAIFQGFLLALLLLLLVSIVLGAVVYFSSWQSNARLLNLLAHFTVLGGSMLAGCRCHKKAWLHGITVGIMVFAVFSWLGYDGVSFVTWLWWKSLLKMLLVAMLGGVLGGLLRFA
jgi:putative membrane protein (TIGR04086 family)